MHSIKDLKQKMFPKGMKRSLARYQNMLFHRTTEKDLVSSISKLGIPPGTVICVHSMLSAFGYLVGGPPIIIRAIQKAVPDCTIMMPTFPYSGTALEYVKSDPVFDPVNTPSQSGLLSEAFRNMPGVKRSSHPTHPCAALGPKADELIQGSENAKTPFGDDSSYGRFSRMEDAVLLLFHTNNTSFVHRIQEMVDMPNLFLQGEFKVKSLYNGNQIKEHSLKIHTPKIPLFVAMQDSKTAEYDYVWLPDYCFPYPDYNRERMESVLKSEEVKKFLFARNKNFFEDDSIKDIDFNGAQIASISVQPWQRRIVNDLTSNLSKQRGVYSFEKMEEMLSRGRLIKYEQ